MSITRYASILLLFLLITVNNSFPQAEPVIERSVITETIDGKDYYLHFVKTGETLFAIARAYGLTVDDIFLANPDSRKGITPGTVLKIPLKKDSLKTESESTTGSDGTFFYHIVKKQETFYGISKKYGVTIEAIKAINPQIGEYPREGETLKIPYREAGDKSGIEEWKGTTIRHTVQPGETLYGIAKKYDVTTGEIKNANPGLSETLTIGATLIIPNQISPETESPSSKDPGPGEFTSHEVVPGETLFGIAREYAVSIDTLKKYNPGLTSTLAPGQVLKIPVNGSSRGYIMHKPKKNETPGVIARKYNVDVRELEKLNPDIRKKIRKGEAIKIPATVSRPKEIPSVEYRQEEPVVSTVEKQCNDEVSHTGTSFNIALMLPLFLEAIDSIKFNEVKDPEQLINLTSFRFAGFYAGFKMAVDSMVNKGMKLNLFIYDVDNDPAKVERALLSSELSSMDLIVGPFYLNSFMKVADFAKIHQIPIVNPLSKREEIVFNNPYVYKLKPSDSKQIDFLIHYLEKNYPATNILVVRSTKYKYQAEVSYIRNSLNTARPAFIHIANRDIDEVLRERGTRKSVLTENKLIDPEFIARNLEDSTRFSNLIKEVVYPDDSITALTMNLSLVRPNVVIAITDEIVFSKMILSQLNKLNLRHDITLFGLPSWNEFTDLETSHLLNLHMHALMPEVVNYSSLQVNSWIRNFRKTYNIDPTPGNYAFDGFDAGWFFLNALFNYGKDFDRCLPYLSLPLLQTNFDFEQKTGSGYQNTYWNLGKYEDYEFKKIKFRME